jgi:hypothetical protein
MNYYDDESLGSGPLTWLSILNGQVYRNSLSSDITLFFPEPASFLFTNVGTKGYYRFIIRNGDPTYTITLVGSNGWVLDPNASFVIQPMTSLLLWLYLFTDSSGNETINIYVIGRMDL